MLEFAPRQDKASDGVRRATAALIAVAGALLATASPAFSPGLSEDVRRRLATGEIVVTDALPPGASQMARGGTALAIVRARPAEVWRVIVDYREHPRYYPRVSATDVVESDERRVVVRYRVTVGPFWSIFFMEKFPDPRQRRVHWHLAPGRPHGLFKENSGYWQVDRSDVEGASLVTYAIAVRTKLPEFVTAGAERDSLLETVNALRKLVEPGR